MDALPIASPSTRALARERNIDLSALAEQLGKRYLSKADLEAPKSAALTMPSPDSQLLGPGERIAQSKIAQVSAKNLMVSQLIPSVTHHDAIDVGALNHWRAAAKSRGRAFSPLSAHVYALARCLRLHPKFNASLIEEGAAIWLKQDVHIGIAVDTEHGLMVPVVRHADQKSLSAITQEIASLAKAARARKLTPDQMQGAGMSISNLGGIGGRGFNPMINPPEVAIMGIMKTRKEPKFDGEQFVAADYCPVDLTYDHRVINGADAARFLVDYVALLEDPRRMML